MEVEVETKQTEGKQTESKELSYDGSWTLTMKRTAKSAPEARLTYKDDDGFFEWSYVSISALDFTYVRKWNARVRLLDMQSRFGNSKKTIVWDDVCKWVSFLENPGPETNLKKLNSELDGHLHELLGLKTRLQQLETIVQTKTQQVKVFDEALSLVKRAEQRSPKAARSPGTSSSSSWFDDLM